MSLEQSPIVAELAAALSAEQVLERFIAELAEDEELLPMVSAYDGQIAQMQALGMQFDDIVRVHDGMFSAYARARGWQVFSGQEPDEPPEFPIPTAET